jgi:hypothetical protein
MLGVVSEVIVTAVAVAGALAGAATTRRVADGKDGRGDQSGEQRGRWVQARGCRSGEGRAADLADRRQGRVQKAAAAAAATSSSHQQPPAAADKKGGVQLQLDRLA